MGVDSIVSLDSQGNLDVMSDGGEGISSPRNNLIEISKMRKLEDARRKWETRHNSNSPFRAENYGSSSSLGPGDNDSVSSGMSLNRGYGVRMVNGHQQSPQMRKFSGQNQSAAANSSASAANSSTFKRSQSKTTNSALRLNNGTSGNQASVLASIENVNGTAIQSLTSSSLNGIHSSNSSDVGAVPVSQEDEILDRFVDSEEEKDMF